MIIIAHNIRSLHNVGAILRNAAAFGAEKVYLTGITGVPPRKEIAKVSLGAEDLISWEAGDISVIIDALRNEGYALWGLETGQDAMNISDIGEMNIQKIALVLGNEVEGIDDVVRAMLDEKIRIPMVKKQSLNVSVASGVAMYVLHSLHL